ncbi:MAG: hypothetical protein O7J95_12745 [Planctomycetota bacterium]|nr:hypothetical protein [Planctomycetota bacterium]
MKKERPVRSQDPLPILPYVVAVAASWALPGAGHVILGYRVRGLLIGATLLGTFWLGESVLADNMAVTYRVHPIFFSLQVGNGASTLWANWCWGEPVHDENQLAAIRDDLPDQLSLGILFCSLSGLLNLLVVLHVMDPRTWTDAARRGDEGSAPAPDPGADNPGENDGG